MSLVETTDNKRCNETKLETLDGVSQEESVDPRVQVELERLNTATDLINKLEIELDEARSSFRLLLSESSIRVNQLAKKLGTCVEKARPYYEARMHAKQLQTQTQKAALRYERASSAHSAAKEMVFLAEEGLKKEGRCFDPAWQEMLNHATLRVNEAESERVLSQHQHQKTSLAYNEAEKIVQHLHQELKKSIVKSSLSTRRSLLQLNNLANQHQLQLLPYFEMKAQFNQLLEEQRRKVHHLEENILKMKVNYADALHNLEEISDEIHQKRSEKKNSKSTDIQGADSLNLSHDAVNTYQKVNSNSFSSENLYQDNLNAEDVYMSLPSKLTLRPDLIAASCKGNNSEKLMLLPSHEEECLEETINKISIENVNYSLKNNSFHHNQQKELEGNDDRQDSINSSSPISNQFKLQNISNNGHEYREDKSNGTQDRPCECEEISDYKFLVPDFNLLRIQREEFSDSESLASNDTTDTLDDNQIECLLLEKGLPLDVQEIETENSLDDYTSKENIHL